MNINSHYIPSSQQSCQELALGPHRYLSAHVSDLTPVSLENLSDLKDA